jgi:hypothetical protein
MMIESQLLTNIALHSGKVSSQHEFVTRSRHLHVYANACNSALLGNNGVVS